MDYLIEAKKFIQHAQVAYNSEVAKTDLRMAEWFLSRAIEDREDTPSQEPPKSTESRPRT